MYCVVNGLEPPLGRHQHDDEYGADQGHETIAGSLPGQGEHNEECAGDCRKNCQDAEQSLPRVSHEIDASTTRTGSNPITTIDLTPREAQLIAGALTLYARLILTVMERKDPPLLTGRETQILDLLAQGAEYREISELLKLSLERIKSHLKRIYRKLGARNGSHTSRTRS
jgi:DNA-binding CsgD family transcriptional regulator